MIKPSIKSLEGQSFLGLVATSLYLLHSIINSVTAIPITTISPFTETAENYTCEVLVQSGYIELGKIAIILIFIYKVYSTFTASRVALKGKGNE